MAFKPRLKIHYSTFSKGDLMSEGIIYTVPFSKNEQNYCLATKNLKDTNFINFFEEVMKILHLIHLEKSSVLKFAVFQGAHTDRIMWYGKLF